MFCRILGFIAFPFYEGRGWEGGTLCTLYAQPFLQQPVSGEAYPQFDAIL